KTSFYGKLTYMFTSRALPQRRLISAVQSLLSAVLGWRWELGRAKILAYMSACGAAGLLQVGLHVVAARAGSTIPHY
ncbi:hypothetical protein, partial [Mycolicibacterium setense]|uniref:hypothetical protein n=1 Tax=Mycolicibacterium setense TaxID=431269 RepID=UPI0021F2895D